MNVVLALLHEIEEFDQTKLLTELGYDVFSIGSYSDPHNHEGLRPALPAAPDHPELREACDRTRREMEALHGPPGERFDWAKFHLPDEVIDWMDVFIVHHAEHTFIPDQWDRIKGKRVIWRSVGQSVENNEAIMAPFRAQGLERIAYSPRERFIPGYIGHDALIRFYADPDEWHGWTGEDARVINVTQSLRQRDPFTNYGFWREATKDLPATPLGPGSEDIGGPGALAYDEMKDWLRRGRAYLYTGTQPASYTLGLIEALMTGIPVVSISPEFMRIFPYGPDLFEGIVRDTTDESLAGWGPTSEGARAVESARYRLLSFLEYPHLQDSEWQRKRAIGTFGKATIGAQWRAYLGAPVREPVPA